MDVVSNSEQNSNPDENGNNNHVVTIARGDHERKTSCDSDSRIIPAHISPAPSSPSEANSVGNTCGKSITNPYFPLGSPPIHEMPKFPSPALEHLAQLTQSAQFARLASQSLAFSPLNLSPLLQMPRLMTPFPSPLLGLYGFGTQSLAESTALYLKSRDAISQLSEHKSK